MIKSTWLSVNVTPISFLSGSLLSCALLLLERDLYPLLPKVIRSPGTGRGRQTARPELKEISTSPLVKSGPGEVVPAQEESEPGVLGSVQDLPPGHCVSVASSLPSLNLGVLTEASLPDPLASSCPERPMGL